jgi:hypothetical protein
MERKSKIIVIVGICILVVVAFVILSKTTIGSNSKGYVTKQVMGYPVPHQTKIAVITGMHPRELHATNLVPLVLQLYALLNNVEIVNYQVGVTDHPNDFDIGRSNGQALVAQYVNPDIIKSNYSMVIICHDHEQGYGEGYYFATPTHDSKSVSLGQKVSKLLPEFNYYPGSASSSYEATSISQVDQPLTQSGIPVFVYEIPENSDNYQAFSMTYNLINSCFKALST